MGIFSSFFASRSASVIPDDAWRSVLINSSHAGVDVNPTTAMQVSAVYACVRILADNVASLPLLLYEMDGEQRARATEHPLYRVLHDTPNSEQTSYKFRHLMMVHLLLYGNFYSEVVRDNAGDVAQLWPLRPDRMTPTRVGERIVYKYNQPGVPPLPAEKVLHIKGLGLGGLIGLSVIGNAREAAGLALATEEYGAKLFSNGGRPTGVLKHPGTLKPAARDNISASWEATYGGLGNAHKVALLEEGLEFQALGIPPEDAQFLQTRKHQTIDIANFFGVPPHKLGELARATHTNIEHNSMEFVRETLTPWLVNIEQELARTLVAPQDQGRIFPQFLVEGLLRGDTSTRYESYAVGRQNGWLSANDIRRLENMMPIEGGDQYLVPLNMVPADQIGQVDASDDEPTPTRRSASRALPDKVAAAAQRQKLAATQAPVMTDALTRVLRREAADIERAAKKFKNDPAGFAAWLDVFYKDHSSFIGRQLMPALVAFATMVADLVTLELGKPANEDWAAYVERYVDRYAARHVGKSRKQLETAVQADNRDRALEETFSDWREIRPSSVARGESNRFGNAIAKAAYMGLGVSYLTWHTLGESCPWCQMLDGRKVPIGENFLTAGDELAPEGDHKPMAMSGDVGHPPAHAGCDCQMTAG